MGPGEDVTEGAANGKDETENEAGEPEPSTPMSPAPPLPPRRKSTVDAFYQARPTTAISPIDIQTLSFPDGSRGTFSSVGMRAVSTPIPEEEGSSVVSAKGSEFGDSMSLRSGFAPTLRPPGDLASLLAGELNHKSRAWLQLRSHSADMPAFAGLRHDVADGLCDFAREFDSIPDLDNDTSDGDRLLRWKSKMKHYMVLSSAGKPIYSRHGDLGLINGYMGVVQTIISFYEGAKNPLLGFTAGNARFVVATKGPLYLVAVSRLGESDAQLRDQLDALYMQILSTLTLPTLQSIFVHRPSTDLRKPLEGTEALLSSLADSFTRGSPSALLGALECLRLRKSDRLAITNAFLRARPPPSANNTSSLLYGLLVAAGKLVSVIRPRKHSLHPSDLQLVFNMLFASDAVRAGGGESWIPLCLPAFNNRGYLYMYVSFLEDGGGHAMTKSDEVAVVLISPDKETFFELKDMRDKVAEQLARNGSLAVIAAAVRAGRPRVAALAPGAPLSHFLFKSRANVQFCMSSLSPAFADDHENGLQADEEKLVARRRLMTLYHQLHAAVHARHSHLRVLHCVGEDASSLAWVTAAFDFYCVAGPNVSRTAMTQAANRIVEWAKREEERLFIIGGGVF